MKARYYIVALVVLVAMAKGCAPASAQVSPQEDPHRYYHQERPEPVVQHQSHGYHHDRHDADLNLARLRRIDGRLARARSCRRRRHAASGQPRCAGC